MDSEFANAPAWMSGTTGMICAIPIVFLLFVIAGLIIIKSAASLANKGENKIDAVEYGQAIMNCQKYYGNRWPKPGHSGMWFGNIWITEDDFLHKYRETEDKQLKDMDKLVQEAIRRNF